VRYPFSRGNECKLRPALIISNSRYNNKQMDVLACPITSKLKEVEYSVIIETKDLEGGMLKKKCRVRCDKVGSIEKSLIVHRIGIVKKEIFENVKTEIFAVLSE
jgi:mRNA interferase MazF